MLWGPGTLLMKNVNRAGSHGECREIAARCVADSDAKALKSPVFHGAPAAAVLSFITPEKRKGLQAGLEGGKRKREREDRMLRMRVLIKAR